MRRARQNLRAVLQVPLALFGLGLFGLLAALWVEGPMDALAVVASASALPVILWAVFRAWRAPR